MIDLNFLHLSFASSRLFLNLVRIGEKHGVKFPREFGLFLKQILYFDRYTRILAPSLQVTWDEIQ